MKALTEAVGRALVDKPDEVRIKEVIGEHAHVLELCVAKEDLVSCPSDSFTKWFEFLEDRAGRCCPREGTTAAVVVLHEGLDLFHEISDTPEGASPDRPLCDDVEPDLDLVEPRGVGRGVVHMDAPSPLLHRLLRRALFFGQVGIVEAFRTCEHDPRYAGPAPVPSSIVAPPPTSPTRSAPPPTLPSVVPASSRPSCTRKNVDGLHLFKSLQTQDTTSSHGI